VKSDGNVFFLRNEPGEEFRTSGTIRLTERSSFKFFTKEFTPVTGTITFIKDISNPELDIAAEYTGQHTIPTTTPPVSEPIKIVLLVHGTRNDPQLTMELYRKNTQGDFIKDPRSQDLVSNDVLSYLATGNF